MHKTISSLLIIVVLCCVAYFTWESIQRENVCWAAGYEIDIVYRGELYCFGSGGEGAVWKAE
jgi:hypothetical protein